MSDLIIKELSQIENGDYVWDEFIENGSINGTFLQTRKFLNYHPVGRFVDDSILIYDKNKIVAVCPAVNVDNYSCWFSHPGSTFGGPVIAKKYYNICHILDIIETLNNYIKDKGYKRIVLKPTNDLFDTERSDLLRYSLKYWGYYPYEELTSYIDLSMCNADVKDLFDRNKNRNIKKCEEHELIFREIFEEKEISEFHNLLKINLTKYNLKPVHTVDEMIDLKKHRIPDNVKFFGLYEDDTMMAGGMIFLFPETNVLHAQNLSADYTFTEYSPITYIYYKMIQYAKDNEYEKVSWGISTEDWGRVLNHSLIRNKESYGSKHLINYIYEKYI